MDVEIVGLPSLPGVKDVVWWVLFEEALLPFRARAFDLLYCQADLAPCFGRTPTVVLLRNLNIYDRRWYDDLRTRTLARLVGWGLPHSRRILFPSHAAARLVSERMPVPQDRISVVPYGISLQAFETGESAAPGSRYLFLPAAIERHKNIAVLIESLRHLGDSSLEIWIAGISLLDPEHQIDLERRAEELGVRDRVRFLGLVPYNRDAALLPRRHGARLPLLDRVLRASSARGDGGRNAGGRVRHSDLSGDRRGRGAVFSAGGSGRPGAQRRRPSRRSRRQPESRRARP